jgi:hypothetical protein
MYGSEEFEGYSNKRMVLAFWPEYLKIPMVRAYRKACTNGTFCTACQKNAGAAKGFRLYTREKRIRCRIQTDERALEFSSFATKFGIYELEVGPHICL